MQRSVTAGEFGGPHLLSEKSAQYCRRMIEPTDLIGTWTFTRDGRPAFLHFTYTQAFDYLEDTGRFQMLRLWYAFEGDDQIRFRNHAGDEGWLCTVRIEDRALILTSHELETVCTRATAEQIPKWFVQELAER
jgi:hypothetical protein